MSKGTSELECEIEASRSRLDGVLAKLRGRLNVSDIVKDTLGIARQSDDGAEFYNGALNAVRRNPVPVLLVCAGAFLLLRQGAKPTSRAYRAHRDPSIATLWLAPTKTPPPSDP